MNGMGQRMNYRFLIERWNDRQQVVFFVESFAFLVIYTIHPIVSARL